jgi:hypothetical protein
MTDGNNVEVEYHHLVRQSIMIIAVRGHGVPRMRDFVTETITNGAPLDQAGDLIMDLTTTACDQET